MLKIKFLLPFQRQPSVDCDHLRMPCSSKALCFRETYSESHELLAVGCKSGAGLELDANACSHGVAHRAGGSTNGFLDVNLVWG